MNKVTTYCVYHSRDLDGWMSGAIVKFFIPGVHLIGYDYGQSIPEIPEDADRVIMADVTFDRPLLEELSKRCQLVIIDHHISTISKVEGLEVFGTVNTKYSACELCWQYFMTSNTPELIRFLGMYDSFRHKGTCEEKYVLEFQYGARKLIHNVDEAYEALLSAVKCFDDDISLCSSINEIGSIIYDYICVEAQSVMKHTFEVSYNEYKFLCVNQERFNPVNYGIDYHTLGYDAFICFWYVNDKFLYSIYNDNGKFDCAEFATRLGGGGHKGAAGWQSTELISNNYLTKMLEFTKYKRTAIAEMRPVTLEEEQNGPEALQAIGVSISQADVSNGSPKLGDMIARNPKNYEDQWLVAKQYFEDNFEPFVEDLRS